jgi:hypothetical protein
MIGAIFAGISLFALLTCIVIVLSAISHELDRIANVFEDEQFFRTEDNEDEEEQA